MIGKLDKSPQLDIFRVMLKHRIREDHELVQLAEKVKWDRISLGLAVHYSPDKGRRAIPVRKMAGMLILKYIYGCSDNSVLRLWLADPSVQYFCGEVYFNEKAVVNRFDLVNFRRRIGEEGMKIIFYPDLLRILNRMKQARESATHSTHSSWHIVDFFRHFFFTKPSTDH
jgi:IS5 family transposase